MKDKGSKGRVIHDENKVISNMYISLSQPLGRDDSFARLLWPEDGISKGEKFIKYQMFLSQGRTATSSPGRCDPVLNPQQEQFMSGTDSEKE